MQQPLKLYILCTYVHIFRVANQNSNFASIVKKHYAPNRNAMLNIIYKMCYLSVKWNFSKVEGNARTAIATIQRVLFCLFKT